MYARVQQLRHRLVAFPLCSAKTRFGRFNRVELLAELWTQPVFFGLWLRILVPLFRPPVNSLLRLYSAKTRFRRFNCVELGCRARVVDGVSRTLAASVVT